MKFGLRMPSLKRRIAARTSWKRVVRHRMGLKAPRGFGLLTNPRRALYNRVYNRTSFSIDRLARFGKRKMPHSLTTPKAQTSISFWVNLIIFSVLAVVFFPLAIAFLLYKLYMHYTARTTASPGLAETAIVPSSTDIRLFNQFSIPEPTRSLLWITDEDTSHISSPMTIKIQFNPATGSAQIDDGHNFRGEPSLIWTRLPVKENNELEAKPMYYPSYAGLAPTHRYQYLKWLTDVTKQTNLSYVFLYYYGLERHLLVGNYDMAVDELLRLLQYHTKGSFKGYATAALIAASAYRKRPEIVRKAPLLLEETSNASLLLRRLAGLSLTARDVINLASRVGYTNKRYIKMYPELFEAELQSLLESYEKMHGSILGSVDPSKLAKRSSICFGNVSLPTHIRNLEIPDLIGSAEFGSALKGLLTNAHEQVKLLKGNALKRQLRARN